MKGSLRKVLFAAAAGSAAVGMGTWWSSANAADEPTCVEVRVWLAGSPTPVGHCQNFVPGWLAPCSRNDVFPLGYGAGATVCAETPV